MRKTRLRKGSHCDRILNFLKDGNTLTSWECIDNLRINNLPQRIAELEQKGYIIIRKTEYDDNNTAHTRYSYEEEDNE